MQNKAVYLLRHLGAPQKKESRSRKYTKALNEAEKYFEIQIYQQPFGQKEMADHTANRFFFRFPRYLCDDEKAIRIGESVLLGIDISYGPLPFSDIFLPNPVYSFPSSLFSKNGFVSENDLNQFEESKPYSEQTYSFLGNLFSSCWISEIHVEAAWRIARVMFSNQDLFNAANFLKSSQEKFYVSPGVLNDVIGNKSAAMTGREQSALEDALVNSFKTIEAVIGDIPKDDRKFFRNLKREGINPHEIVGYSGKNEIYSVLRAINEARDKKGAHGKTTNREIMIGDLLEYQACARFILICAIENILGEKLYY